MNYNYFQQMLAIIAAGAGGGMPTELAAAIALAEAGFVHNGTGNITTSIVSNRASDSNTGVAPYGVQFDATSTATALTTNPFHDLLYVWHFGDDDAATWSYGTLAGISKKNLARGAVAAHAFRTPGTKIVRCTAMHVSSGGVLSVGATQSITVTVTDPDVVFAGDKTICIGKTTPNASDAGVPAGADLRSAATWDDILAIINANPQKRILVKADGAEWTCNNQGTISAAGPGIIGTFGVGAKPVITYSAASRHAISSATGFTDWRVMGFESTAVALATGSARSATRFFDAPDGPTNQGGSYCLLIDNVHHDAGTFALLSNDCMVVDCNAQDLDGGVGNTGIWAYQRQRIAILGSAVNDASRVEMNVRLQGVKNTVISNCLLKDPLANATKHALALRGWSDAGNSYAWTGDYTENIVVSNNVITGVSSSGLVQFASQNITSDERHRNIVFERNYVKCTTNYGACVQASCSATSFRNNLFEAVNGPEYAIALKNSPPLASNGNAILPPVDVWMYGNTFYSASTVAHAGRFVKIDTTNASNISIKNNVVYLPNYTGVKTIVVVTGTPAYVASNNTPDANIGSVSPQFAVTPPVSYADWKPGSGSYAVNSGAYVPVFDDFFGVARIGTYSTGAVLPS